MDVIMSELSQNHISGPHVGNSDCRLEKSRARASLILRCLRCSLALQIVRVDGILRYNDVISL